MPQPTTATATVETLVSSIPVRTARPEPEPSGRSPSPGSSAPAALPSRSVGGCRGPAAPRRSPTATPGFLRNATAVYLRIYLPLMTPALAIVSIYALLLAWNDGNPA